MNPNEEIPPEHVAPRPTTASRSGSALVVIGAGPLMNILLAFVILFVLFAAKGQAVNNGSVDGVQNGSAAAGVLKPGDRIVSVDGVTRRRRRRCASRSARTRCADGVKAKGCVAADAGDGRRSRRDGAAPDAAGQPALRRNGRAKRMLIGFTFGYDYDPLPVGRRRDAARSPACGT